MYLQLLCRASTRSSLIVSPIMLANSWHLCSVWYVCPRQTPCLLSSSTIAGNLVKGISSLEIMYATSNKPLTRSFSSDEAEATAFLMGVLLKISFIVLVGCRSRETAFLCMSDFECLTMLSFSSALPVMPCTNAPVPCSFWWLEGDPRSSTKGSGCDLPHRCLVVMEPLA